MITPTVPVKNMIKALGRLAVEMGAAPAKQKSDNLPEDESETVVVATPVGEQAD